MSSKFIPFLDSSLDGIVISWLESLNFKQKKKHLLRRLLYRGLKMTATLTNRLAHNCSTNNKYKLPLKRFLSRAEPIVCLLLLLRVPLAHNDGLEYLFLKCHCVVSRPSFYINIVRPKKNTILSLSLFLYFFMETTYARMGLCLRSFLAPKHKHFVDQPGGQ